MPRTAASSPGAGRSRTRPPTRCAPAPPPDSARPSPSGKSRPGCGTCPALLAAGESSLQPGHRLVDREARRLLPRRELLERLEELGDDVRRREGDVVVVEEPVVIRVRRHVGALERIGAQVEELRNAE